ncbi:hypothetical protein BDW59DRAFT_18469 [Aspergillus cavernicola]|uniref:Uncharacterized protein n=1 Tax=Aspergillus cavernicola TaxID=176166 RepID=A0ABR4IRZ9_9EURO
MASASDITPLLANSEALEAGEYERPQDVDHITAIQHHPTPSLRTTVVLTHLSAVLAILGFIFDITVISIDAAAPNGFYMYWNLRERVQGMFGISILTVIASSLNLARLRHSRQPLWTWVNLIIDAVIVIYTINLAPEAIALNFDQSPDSWLPDEKAASVARAVVVLLGIGLISGLIGGLVHLILFPLRCYASFKSGSWRNPQAWRIPSGEFKIEFSVKFLRQEGARESRAPEL